MSICLSARRCCRAECRQEGSSCQADTPTTEAAALSHPQGRTAAIPTQPGNRLSRPAILVVVLEVVVAARVVVVVKARSSEGRLADQVVDRDLEVETQIRAVTRATAQPQFTEAEMSWACRGEN